MKRKAPNVPPRPENPGSGPERRRRQPQTSCDFCRAKKLKCLGNPCDSCVVRRLQCRGRPPSAAELGYGNAASPSTIPRASLPVQARLHSLEQAVFGPGTAAPYTAAATPDSSTASTSALNTDGQQTANRLDWAHSRRDHVATSTYGESGHLSRAISDGTLMTHQEALSLLQDVVNNPCHLLAIIHEPSTRQLFDAFYASLAEPANGAVTANPVHAALILSIAATSAAFFSVGMSSAHEFASSEEAARASLRWSRSAQHILDEALEIAASAGGLEEAQARAILAHLVYNREGSSARFRLLHSVAVAVARDASLHLVDSPDYAASSSAEHDSVVAREVKRRVWWHIAATDWMLGTMGGPFDGTYAVHPQQMNVRYPRNLNDNDLTVLDDATTFPLNVATQMSCFLQRIRLAEICRAVVDAREPGRPSADVADPARVLELDRLFAEALAAFPPALQLDAPVTVNVPHYWHLQRAIIHIAFHSRRARLHRPLLLAAQRSQLRQRQQQQCRTSRNICLRSARTVVSTTVALFEDSLAAASTHTPPSSSGQPLTHRLAVFISHLFTACTILALHVSRHFSETDNSNPDDDAAICDFEINDELSRACAVLQAAGQESAVAARLVRALTDSLRRYRDSGTVPGGNTSAADTQHSDAVAAVLPPTGRRILAESAVGSDPVCRKVGDYGLTEQVDTGLGDEPSAWDLDTLWADFPDVLAAGNTWDQLFANLESYCGQT